MFDSGEQVRVGLEGEHGATFHQSNDHQHALDLYQYACEPHRNGCSKHFRPLQSSGRNVQFQSGKGRIIWLWHTSYNLSRM